MLRLVTFSYVSRVADDLWKGDGRTRLGGEGCSSSGSL